MLSDTTSTERTPEAGSNPVVSALRNEVAGLRITIQTLEGAIVNLTHENVILKRRLFGNKTEKAHTNELQLALGDLLDREKELQKELDKAILASQEAAGSGDGQAKKNPKTPRPHGRRDLSVSSLPKVPVEITDPELEKQGKRIGVDVSYQLMYRRGGFSVLVRQVVKYEILKKDNSTTILAAEVPKSIFPRGLLHESSIVHIIVQKFALGVPHYRLEKYLADNGLELDRGTMSRYVEEAGNTLGATVVAAMWNDARENAHILSTDATSSLIQPEPAPKGQHRACKKGHFFTVVADCDYVFFHFSEKHNHAAVQNLFGGFRGLLQADASNVYDVLDRGPPEDTDQGLLLVGCWAHCRRYFFEAAICKYDVGVRGLTLIQSIYAADENFSKLPPSRRKELRDIHVRPLIDQFFDWVREAKGREPGRNLATKALGYATNQEHELRRVLLDGRLPLDNTRSERSLRKIVVGRKAWLFYGSDVHAESAAALFSIIATCRLHKVAPEQYLEEVFRLLPFWPRERYLELSPRHWSKTRARLDPAELEALVGAVTVPSL